MNTKTICLFNTTKNWGGGEKWHSDTALFLSKKNYRIIVFTHKNSELYNNLKNQQGISLFTVKIKSISFLNPIKIIQLKKKFKILKIDIIIMNLPSDAKAAGWAAKKAGIKHIVYRRGSAIPIKNSIINRYLFKSIITNIIANSEETKRTILQNNQNLFNKKLIKVLYNGININKFEFISNFNLIKKNKITIGNAGRLDKQKAQKYLIDLAVILKHKNIDFEIKIAGKGKLEHDLKAYAIQKKVDKNIEFVGFYNNMNKFYHQIDVFVLTSLWEGFGYVLAEAAACGKPIIAFNLSSNPELIIHNKTGFLVKPFNVNKIAEYIINIKNDKELRQQLSKNSRKMIEDKFSIKKSRQELLSYLDNFN